MKSLYTLIIALSCSVLNAQVFDFYNSIYFVPETLSVVEPGISLVNSNTNLSQFDFNTAPSDHPIYQGGIFYPINDCSNQNLWIRLQHIAADPNGTENGHSISTSMNSPFLPYGSTDRIGGWNGFYYEFQIFQDVALTGTRTNILGELYPTGLTVASLETLYNDGGTMFEWLAFEILNPESSGWYLNSTNFTGINPFSTPGFSAELNYSTTGTAVSAPTGFSTEFPYGSQNIYAVDMNLSSAYHSEFKMSAAGVTKFRYGYEFTPGGYQGMSMEFGVPPVVNSLVQPSCGTNAGSIALEVTGTEPITAEWGNDMTGLILNDLASGTYAVTVTDGNGCTFTQEFTIAQFDAFTAEIDLIMDGDMPVLQTSTTGGIGDFTYQWSDGSTDAFVANPEAGLYEVEITDVYGCVATASILITGIEENRINSGVVVYPNPMNDLAEIRMTDVASQLIVYDTQGNLVRDINIAKGSKTVFLDLKDQQTGIYFFKLLNEGLTISNGKVIVQR